MTEDFNLNAEIERVVNYVTDFVERLTDEDYRRWEDSANFRLKCIKKCIESRAFDRLADLCSPTIFGVTVSVNAEAVSDGVVEYICRYFTETRARGRNYLFTGLEFGGAVSTATILKSYGGDCNIYADKFFNDYINGFDEEARASAVEWRLYSERIAEHVTHLLISRECKNHITEVMLASARAKALSRFKGEVMPRLNQKYLKFIAYVYSPFAEEHDLSDYIRAKR